MRSEPAGFTLIELMIVITLLAVLMMIAAPSVRELTLNARLTGQTNDLMTDLAMARAEAIRRGMRASICPSTQTAGCSVANPAVGACGCTNTPWNEGWIVFVDAGPQDDGAAVWGQVDLGLVAPSVPDTILKVVPALDGVVVGTPASNNPSAITITPANLLAVTGGYIGFRPSGILNNNVAATFDLCDSRTGAGTDAVNRGRRITVTATGRASVARRTCP